ncbi:MAG: bifunctional [glutamine synthetase] adenylyltransferase/[glutamine synthetase]-adenylyl-L-tyrosine phosphorylase [Actinobacteria bacterium]|nr:bifunctional [glutamine synthetase] adenylyltransferase/[glutamine synthetase]-adenylyl-L-tyrosine phosphorylase [Actinomycetota bacterium]
MVLAPVLNEPIERAADPGIARAVVERVVEAHPEVADDLAERALVRDGLIALACASRSLSTAVIGHPSLLDPLRDERGFATERDADGYAASWQEHADHSPAGLRGWKRRELLRTAARDLLGLADLPAVGRELAALAETCLGAAVGIVAPDVRLTVVGMGKLGGRELNYASDVDVLFAHDGDADAAERSARELLSTMSTPTPEGIVFRTDADLRPEGKSGPLSRSIDSYAAYWERWAQTWEFQALIKARWVAGDADLGEQFLDAARPHVWPEMLDPDAVREVRAMKGRAESETARKGLTERELKRGRGGIRDIEFAVQLLQLVHGRHDESVRPANTLAALGALAAADYVGRPDADELDEAYRYLRTVEHRLQLWDEQQTHTLPSDGTARRRLARVMGYRDRGDGSAVERFDADHRAQQARVRTIHERLFFAPILDTLAGAGPLTGEAVEERLTAFGFVDVASTRAALRELATGLTRRSKVMQQLLPVILGWLSAAPDPDLGLLQLRRLAEGPARSASLATTFRESPGAAERACRLLGSGRVLGEALRRQPDFVEALGDDEALAREKTRAELVEEALGTLGWRGGAEQRREGLRRFKRRELLRIAARDVLGFATVEEAGRELAGVAEACVEAALRMLEPEQPFAVIGMGRFGGGELSYASDIDVLFVYDGDTPADFAAAERTAEALMREIGATTAEGQTFRIDADLRPEGKQGPLARSVDGYRTYYERWAKTWEFQALLKARPVAGDPELGKRFAALVEPFVYRDPFPDDAVREVRRMKARIERERIPPGEDPEFHLKLGRGSLSDVEFTVQLLQLVHGAIRPEVRATATIEALRRLQEAGLIDNDDATALEESYRFCERARNARYLLTGSPTDALPTDGAEALKLARVLGYIHRPQASLRDDYRRVTRRARKVFEQTFYGRAET